MPDRLPILIAGAGPTGLLLAIWLKHFNIPHRIVDPKSGTGSESRALIVHARTLEFYDALGFADTIVAAGERLLSMRVRFKGEERVRVATGASGEGLTRFPFSLCLGQDEHEALLLKELQKRGGDVEWGTRVMGVEVKGEKEYVAVTLERGDGKRETVGSQYIAGCDGGHSTVRRCAGLTMEGGTYARRFFVADVRGTGSALDADPSINMCLAPHDFCFVLRLKSSEDSTRAARLTGFTPEGVSETDVTIQDCLPSLRAALGNVDIQHVDWFSHYKVHHRHVDSFRKGRIFVFGDAAHLHSPVGGQGMNTGLGDVTNFAWKFATHLQTPGGNEVLLDTYHAERFGFAQQLVKTTDAAFTHMTSASYTSIFIRSVVMPRIFPLIAKVVDVAGKMFGRTSQLGIAYPQSGLSVNVANIGKVKAGDRLPYVEYSKENGEMASNHATMRAVGWQAHVYGGADWADVMNDEGVPMHRFEWDDAAAEKGLARGAFYLVRPDGYIGLILGKQDQGAAGVLEGYMAKWGVAAGQL